MFAAVITVHVCTEGSLRLSRSNVRALVGICNKSIVGATASPLDFPRSYSVERKGLQSHATSGPHGSPMMGTPRLQVPVVIVICFFAWLFAVRLSSDCVSCVTSMSSFLVIAPRICDKSRSSTNLSALKHGNFCHGNCPGCSLVKAFATDMFVSAGHHSTFLSGMKPMISSPSHPFGSTLRATCLQILIRS